MTQKQRESSTANESAVVTLFPEKLQNMGTLLTSTGYQLLTLERNNQRRLKRVMPKQQKLETKGLKNGENTN